MALQNFKYGYDNNGELKLENTILYWTLSFRIYFLIMSINLLLLTKIPGKYDGCSLVSRWLQIIRLVLWSIFFSNVWYHSVPSEKKGPELRHDQVFLLSRFPFLSRIVTCWDSFTCFLINFSVLLLHRLFQCLLLYQGRLLR